MYKGQHQEKRAERMAQYKEERRKQLAAQFSLPNETYKKKNSSSSSSNGSTSPRTTKTSRLRSSAQANTNSKQILEKIKPSVPDTIALDIIKLREERDKSNKRKSNLNRSLTSEEVPTVDINDIKGRRRRRRFFPQELFEKESNSYNDDKKSTLNSTASLSLTSPLASTALSPHTIYGKSQLNINMENTQKVDLPEVSEVDNTNQLPECSVAVSSPEKNFNYNVESNSLQLESNQDKNSSKMRIVTEEIQELTLLTKDALSKVDLLVNKQTDNNNESPRKTTSQKPSSILKKKSLEDSGPISILKRKVLQDYLSTPSVSHTPPVTFSPNVVEPSTSNRKQGILKKRRSLDESQVMRHRSCSPDVVHSSRSILKTQRRSSLEELTRTRSPELHGILKRKNFKHEDDESFSSPQGILKRRSGTSSAGSCGSSPHISITTAVILAVADGAEMVLVDENESVKPILKKKSVDEQCDINGTPKPILKKKSSTETEESDEKPKPILKMSKSIEIHYTTNDQDDIKRTMKQQSRLSFIDNSNELETQKKVSETSSNESDSKQRPISVLQLVSNFESNLSSTGAIPKRTYPKRDRYKTQPVTSNEFEASLNFINFEEKISNHNTYSLLNYQSSCEINKTSHDSLTDYNYSACSNKSEKMSSDSAFQSLGDGLEVEQDNKINKPKSLNIDTNKTKLQMKAIAAEAQKFKLHNENGLGIRKNSGNTSSRFFTQPVTQNEVEKATKINEETEGVDPSRLKLSDKIKLFNQKLNDNITNSKCVNKNLPKQHLNYLQSQNITSDNDQTAACTVTLDNNNEVKSCQGDYLNSKTASGNNLQLPPPLQNEKTVLKKDEDNNNVTNNLDNHDLTNDEGISCNDSASDSDSLSVPKSTVKCNKSSGSDGESSGGREIQNIFQNEKHLNIKEKLEFVLSKSKSQNNVGNEIELSTNRNIKKSRTQAAMPRTIAEIQAKLQQSGESEWKKRIQQNNNSDGELKLLKDKNRFNDELSAEKSILSLKKDELDAASQHWKSRVEKSDVDKFSIAGRMDKSNKNNLSINIPQSDENKKPKAKRFKGKQSDSTPVSPEKSGFFNLSRSISLPDADQQEPPVPSDMQIIMKKVTVSKPDDFTFKNFYKSIEGTKNFEHIDLSPDDFDLITRQSLLAQKKNIQVQKRRLASKNPIKALAKRSDICDEYTEIITGVAEREKKRISIEKMAKSSNLAVEALAGLASKEDFKSVALKKPSLSTALVPFKNTMLLLVKGRRHVQTRLVEPISESLNEGDVFILITATSLFTYIGEYSNIIEQSRAADIVNHIQQTSDLGCKIDKIITITWKDPESNETFWKILGGKPKNITLAGHPDEDEIYESNILKTNMFYTVEDNELVPLDEYWGSIPKIKMLESKEVIVFDFGSEMYIWSGKNAPFDKKKKALKLAKELWDEGYNYSECSICPLNVAYILGDKPQNEVSLKDNKRPEWALFAKITQHRETILFKEKFLDWPDFSRVIRLKSNENDKYVDVNFDISPCDLDDKYNYSEPDLIIHGYHLGRGDKYYDKEWKRLFEFETIKITVWKILENTFQKLSKSSIGHFYDGYSYVLRWNYQMTVKGKDLNGKPSKHIHSGREACIYFCWQGINASINEKGCAALLTIELDNEKAPQVNIEQGYEPAAFLKLFNGEMIVYSGKYDDEKHHIENHLFIVQGEIENEIFIVEVPCNIQSLRSRTSFILINKSNKIFYIWHGCKSTMQKRKVTKLFADKINKKNLMEIYFDNIIEIEEGDENEDFLYCIGGKNRELYISLLNNNLNFDFTMKMYHLSSLSGVFKGTQILCPYRSDYSSPYPFLQSDLYSASQPAIFLIDNHHELWLWQGWWPETEKQVNLSDQTGSGAVRWQAERRASMQTTINYWRKIHDDDIENIQAYIVWAGLEPLEFQNLFPSWINRNDIAQFNLKENRKIGEKIMIEKELKLLSRTIYSLNEILQRPLPEGVDPTHLEIYLSDNDFEYLLSMTKDNFYKLPVWKQTALKKEKGLF